MRGRYFQNGTYGVLSPADMGLAYGSFEKRVLDGETAFDSGGQELALVVLGGAVTYAIGDARGAAEHRDVLYLPIHERISLCGKATVLCYGAPCTKKTAFAHIPFKAVDGDERHKQYGSPAQSTARHVWNCIDDAFDASRLLLGFCDGEPGGWTAWPPHEHGQAREEIYYYTGLGDGFALQCVYDDLTQSDAVRIVREGDLISIPGGYHPNVGCPKTGIHYLFCMVSVQEGNRQFMDLTIQKEFGDKLE